MPDHARRKTALITGASGGIGHALSYHFARDGHNLVLVARSRDQLNAMAAELEDHFPVSVHIIAMDLSDPRSPEAIVEKVRDKERSIDFLVNNAGFGLLGKFAETDLRDELDMLQLNIVSLTHLTKLILPDLLEKGEGKILNLGSIVSFQPGPLMAVYSASKAYVLSFSEALASELEGTGITVTALCPGPTRTGFAKRALMENAKSFQKPMDVESVASCGYRQMMRGKSVVVPGRKYRWIQRFSRFLPRKVVTRSAKAMQSH
ncbi:SDR family NAD(P)-dependent oxidoreductase [Paludifilum halophilum]|uniref:Short-chain dehydrogenase n=1 Tax=Paludifilum halophilum TaxID=1642702 RepID=A0A235B558_9BACL|nr:SDR family oxidoreductase [Paludifilum halophilum]OYD07372.1 short-chain dehydrogenase [Paludifilum halophilum]